MSQLNTEALAIATYRAVCDDLGIVAGEWKDLNDEAKESFRNTAGKVILFYPRAYADVASSVLREGAGW